MDSSAVAHASRTESDEGKDVSKLKDDDAAALSCATAAATKPRSARDLRAILVIGGV